MKYTISTESKGLNEAVATVGEFFLTLLHSATNTHILHLQTRSYSEHVALGAFYDSIVELVDGVIEAYQGKNQTLVQYPNTYYPPVTNALSELKALSEYVQTNRNVVGTDSELQNLMDGVQDLIDSTIYKLTFLK